MRGAAPIPDVRGRRLAAAARTNSADTVDASDADAIVQTALFGSPSTDNPNLRALRTSESHCQIVRRTPSSSAAWR